MRGKGIELRIAEFGKDLRSNSDEADDVAQRVESVCSPVALEAYRERCKRIVNSIRTHAECTQG